MVATSKTRANVARQESCQVRQQTTGGVALLHIQMRDSSDIRGFRGHMMSSIKQLCEFEALHWHNALAGAGKHLRTSGQTATS